MRVFAFTVAALLAAAPAFAQQNPGPDSAYQRHQASRHFAHAGDSAAHTARETGKALSAGAQATGRAVHSEYNRVTNSTD